MNDFEKVYVTYKDFGAKGDGVTEDFDAIVKCHEYANAHGCAVKADPGATYYIGETGGVSAIVKTDVDWGDATFIIDDRNIPVPSPSRTAAIFRILREHDSRTLDESSEIVKAINARGGFKADITNIGYAPGYPCLLNIFDHTRSCYNRWGVHATGKLNPQRELVVVDAEGNIDPATALLLDYTHVTLIEEHRIDDAPITLQNGKFITRANAAPPVYTAYSRNLSFERSNVTIKNTIHEITDETDTGAPYGGFIRWFALNNLRCENLKLQSHKSYKDYNPDGTVHSIMGSYDVGGHLATNIRFVDCIQTNFYKDEANRIAYNETERWGIMGTNYCKNLIYDHCLLSRLDAHAGVYNVEIKDTTISYIKLTGGGKAVIDHCIVIAPENQARTLYELRSDYGSTWKGEILIKDTTFYNMPGKPVILTSAYWNNWDFGYTTYLPDITVDNLTVVYPDTVYAFSNLVGDTSVHMDAPTMADGTENKNPMVINATVTVKNNLAGHTYAGSMNEYLNSKVTIVEE